jgi:hypothetical protein
MTETQLKERLSADVEDIEAPSDLLERARAGGARRLRRRRFTALAGTALTVAAVVAGVATVPVLLDGSAPNRPAATPAPITPAADDPYAPLMNGETRGDLAGDTAYLDQVLTEWRRLTRGQALSRPGIAVIEVVGEPKVYWAGHTPAGRVAVVAQHVSIRAQGQIKLALEGVYTLVGFIGEAKPGEPTPFLVGYPDRGTGRIPTYIASKDGANVIVAVDVGLPAGWSSGADAKGRHQYTPLRFENGVSVLELPPAVDPTKVTVLPLR